MSTSSQANHPLLQRLEKKVKETQTRRGIQHFLHYLPSHSAWGLLGGTTAAVIAQVANQADFSWVGPVVGGLVGMTWAGVSAYRNTPNRTGAALELDKAFALNERMVTLATLTDEQRKSAAGQLLEEDARVHLEKVDVPSKFPFESKARAWAAPAGAALAASVALLFPLSFSTNTAIAKEKDKQVKTTDVTEKIDLKAIKEANEARKVRLKELGSQELNELQQELDQLVEKIEKNNEKGNASPKLALEDITKMMEQIQKREDPREKIKEIEKKLKLELADKLGKQDGPAEDFAKALSQANFDKAKDELMKLADKLKKDELTPEEKKKLVDQMKDLKNKLDEIAKRKEKMDNLEKSGADPETKQAEKNKLEKEMEKLKDLADLAKEMAEAAEKMEKGDAGEKADAMQQLKKMAEQMEKMELTQKELEEMQICEGDLDELKKAIAGIKKGKGGKGGEKQNKWGEENDWGKGGQGDQPGQGGDPTSEAIEGGQRGEEINDTKSEDSNAKSKHAANGKMTIVGSGPKQDKPTQDPKAKDKITLSTTELDRTRQEAGEALRQSKIGQSQKELVSEFYKNLTPDKKK